MSKIKKIWWEVEDDIFGIRIMSNKRKTIYFRNYDKDPCHPGICPLCEKSLCKKFRSPLSPKIHSFEYFCSNLDEIYKINEFMKKSKINYAYVGPDCIITRTYKRKSI